MTEPAPTSAGSRRQDGWSGWVGPFVLLYAAFAVFAFTSDADFHPVLSLLILPGAFAGAGVWLRRKVELDYDASLAEQERAGED